MTSPKYRLHHEDNKIRLVETETKYVIKVFKSKNKAAKYLNHLNNEGGFDGFTPTFFIRRKDQLST